MRLGRHLRELSQLRVGLAVSVAVALFAGLWSIERVSLFPPGIKARPLEIASATTRVMIEGPTSTPLDLSVNTYDLVSLTNRAELVGNMMASPPVRSFIAARAGVPVSRLQVVSPITVDFPRQLSTDGTKHSSDILKSTDEYRINIQVNPTVPIVDIYATAPTVRAAAGLASGVVDGMNDYVRTVGVQQGIKLNRQVHLSQLGRPHGELINASVQWKVALLSFLLVFCASCLATIAIARVRKGWSAAGPSSPAPLVPPATPATPEGGASWSS
jgi:hypothetical protein